jgi:hypothetical protein
VKWKAVRDGSLPSWTDSEIVSPILHDDDIRAVREIINTIKRDGAQVPRGTGCHVHVDASSPRITWKVLTRLLRLVRHYERLIRKMVGVSSYRSNNCERVNLYALRRMEGAVADDAEDDFWKAWYDGPPPPRDYKLHSSRYHGVNLHAAWYHGTVEFRWFNGTLNPDKAEAYVDLCCALMRTATEGHLIAPGDDSEVAADVTEVLPMLEALGIPKESPAYKVFVERFA